jgi:hypothetical protein
MLPVVLRGASAFAGETLDANGRGVSLSEAAKGALKPALQAAVQAVADGFQGDYGDKQESPQDTAKSTVKSTAKSAGRGKRTSIKRKSDKTKQKVASNKTKQKGRGKLKSATKRVYKAEHHRGGIQFGGKSSANRQGKVADRKQLSKKSSRFSTANTNF